MKDIEKNSESQYFTTEVDNLKRRVAFLEQEQRRLDFLQSLVGIRREGTAGSWHVLTFRWAVEHGRELRAAIDEFLRAFQVPPGLINAKVVVHAGVCHVEKADGSCITEEERNYLLGAFTG